MKHRTKYIHSDKKPTLQFLGAAGTVTGSKFLIRSGKSQVMLDAGLFQGLKEFRLRNWQSPTFKASELDAVVVSHAHIDHSGYIPILVKNHFRKKIFCTRGTSDLLRIVLPDSAHLQEEEARYANRHGYSKHKPALPLYTVENARAALKLLRPCQYGRAIPVSDGINVFFRRSGHILGSATVEMQLGKQRPLKIVFSGDLGRWNQPILRDPDLVPEADVLLLESTYGDLVHESNPEEELARVVNQSVDRGGVLVIPAFAVGRTQLLIWMLSKLEEERKIPILPVYVDSPMAMDVTDIYCTHPEDTDLDMAKITDENQCPLCCRRFYAINKPEDSKRLNHIRSRAIIISASGMATGGRILHHLFVRLPNPKNTVLLVGYQAVGTRGRSLQDGVKDIRMFGQQVRVKAKIETLKSFSAHADRRDIFRWLRGFKKPPRQTYLVHAEPEVARKLAASIRQALRWNVALPVDGQTVTLVKS